MSRQTFDKRAPSYYYKGQELDKDLGKNLTEAIRSGEIDRIKSVLMSGVTVNLRGENNRTVFHNLLLIPEDELSEDRRLQICDLLYGYSAMIDQPDAYGTTPLHIAVQKQYSKIVKWLLMKGCSATTKDSQGRTPLHYAVSPTTDKCAVEQKVSDLTVTGDVNQQAATRVIEPLRSIYDSVISLLSGDTKSFDLEDQVDVETLSKTQLSLQKFIKKLDRIDEIYSGSKEENKIQQQLNEELLSEFANKYGDFDEGRIITILGRICNESYHELMVRTENVLEPMKIEPKTKLNDILPYSSNKLS